jgi:(R,R)-butanediol dehydrogenase/meso-butanediol dehydrogenase/diacetyl reductase
MVLRKRRSTDASITADHLYRPDEKASLMRAVRYHGQRDIRVEQVDYPEPDTGEVLIEVEACGICGSDLHEYAAGPMTVPDEKSHPVTGERLPITMGHEFSGIVRETGSNVSLRIGTPVAVNPIICCGECQYCLEGNYHRCEVGGFIGLSGFGGGFAEQVAVDVGNVVPLPDGVSTEHAALTDPFSVGLHAVRRSGLEPSDDVAVFGCGPIGLTLVQVIRAAGASQVYAVEPRETRRKLAAECGADILINPMTDDPGDVIRSDTRGGVATAFEVAGIDATVNQALESTRRGGDVTIISLFEDAIEFQPNNIVLGERTVTGTLAFLGGPLSDREFTMTLQDFATGVFDPEILITDRIELERTEEGFERLLDKTSEQVKILVHP